ncbi:hypothetical protein [Hymenobacter norwichensis]|uniref:hypothetical protein n=1 Tax=Hymenobacter norwichensis TaxID=223903 RepID=UPI00146EF4B4|nr:hypothetical protein [Hymenobacter norwichensis]
MKTTLLTFLFMLCTLFVQAQQSTPVRYDSQVDGNWNNPSTWTIISGDGPGVSRFPAPGANNVVNVTTNVRLNIDYDVSGRNGALSIFPNGSLVDGGNRTLTLGEQTGGPSDRLNVQARSNRTLALDLYKINFIKTDALIYANINVSSCVTFVVSNDITLTATFTIGGNLINDQGNSSINKGQQKAGNLVVAGKILGYNNANQIRQFINTNYTEGPVALDCNAAPLPVELSSFTAAYDNNQVNLRWITASEKNSADFTVERSFNGETFTEVAKVAAAGTSSARREYAATDLGMRKGLNYYRLKQTDLDGTFSYTQVIPVQVGSVKQQLQAYGDNGNLNIVLQTEAALQTLRVFDNMGRMVYTENLTSPTTGLVTRQIPVTGINNRQMYIVQVVTSEGVLSGKFLIAK